MKRNFDTMELLTSSMTHIKTTDSIQVTRARQERRREPLLTKIPKELEHIVFNYAHGLHEKEMFRDVLKKELTIDFEHIGRLLQKFEDDIIEYGNYNFSERVIDYYDNHNMKIQLKLLKHLGIPEDLPGDVKRFLERLIEYGAAQKQLKNELDAQLECKSAVNAQRLNKRRRREMMEIDE